MRKVKSQWVSDDIRNVLDVRVYLG